jgi:hypothetical protein
MSNTNQRKIILPITSTTEDDMIDASSYFVEIFQDFRKPYVKANQQYKMNIMQRVLDRLEEDGASVWRRLPEDDDASLEEITDPMKVKTQLLKAFAKHEEHMRRQLHTTSKLFDTKPPAKRKPNRPSVEATSSICKKQKPPSPPLGMIVSSAITTTTRHGRRIRPPAKHRDDNYDHYDNQEEEEEEEQDHSLTSSSKGWRLYQAPSMVDSAPKEDLELFFNVFGHRRVPPGWIGNRELADYVSWQRHLTRERALRYHNSDELVVSENEEDCVSWKLMRTDSEDEERYHVGTQEEEGEWIVV